MKQQLAHSIASTTPAAPGAVYAMSFAALSCVLHFLFAYGILLFLHPHEDAYILFIYAENLGAEGHLGYYSGGPPTEGATDFLWMLMLAGAVALGVEVAVAAALLNAFGSAVISFLLCRHLLDRMQTSRILIAAFFSLLVPFFSLTLASHLGFSTQLYAALCLLVFLILWRGSGRKWIALPYACLLMGLLRPDGVIIGAVAFFCSLPLIDKQALPRYLIHSFASLTVAVAYFLWRFITYGHWLPLPLIVKSASDQAWPGLEPSLDWATWAVVLILLNLATSITFKRPLARGVLALLPYGTLLLALLFAEQTQNVFFRLQAPASIVLLFLTGDLFRRLTAGEAWHAPRFTSPKVFMRVRRVAVPSVVILFFVIHLTQSGIFFSRMIIDYRLTEYINYFPYHLAEQITERPRVALTEAGRLSYWMDPTVFDLVGLNTAATALHGATPDFIEAKQVDMIMTHIGDWIEVEGCGAADFCQIGPEAVSAAAAGSEAGWRSTNNRIEQATYATMSFLDRNRNEWWVYLVRYHGYRRFSHVYGLKRGGAITKAAFEQALRVSFSDEGRLSHLEMKERGIDLEW